MSEDSPRPPMLTPIPLGNDRRIDELADQLAACRSDLTDDQRHLLERALAYRCRSFPRDAPAVDPESVG